MRDYKNMKNELSILELGSSWEILENDFKKCGDGKIFDRVRYVCNFTKVFVTIIYYIPEISCPTDQGLCLQQQMEFAIKALPKYNQLPTHPLLYHNCELQRATQVLDTILFRVPIVIFLQAPEFSG